MPPYGNYSGYAAGGGGPPQGATYPGYSSFVGAPPPPPPGPPPPPNAAYGAPVHGGYYPPLSSPMAAAPRPPPPPPQPHPMQAPMSQAPMSMPAPMAMQMPTAPSPVAYNPAVAGPYQSTQPQAKKKLFGGRRSSKAASAWHAPAPPPVAAPPPAPSMFARQPPPPPVSAAPAPTLGPALAPAPSSIPPTTATDENNVIAESIYGATPDQIRRASEYNERESQRLLNSLMQSNGAKGKRGKLAGTKKMSKKEMQSVTTKAYAHANEAKRLARKAEMMEAELLLAEEEREHDEMQRRRQGGEGILGYGCAAMPGGKGRDEGRDQPGDNRYAAENVQEDDDFNLTLCGAFGGGAGGKDRPLSPSPSANTNRFGSAIRGGGSHHNPDAHNSIIGPPSTIMRPSSPPHAPSIRTRPSSPAPSTGRRPSSPFALNSVGSGAVGSRAMSSVRLNPTIPSYDIVQSRDAAEDDAAEEKKSSSKGLGVLGLFRGRSKSRDVPTEDEEEDNNRIDHLLALSRSISRDGMPLRNPVIVNGIHHVEDEVNDILNHEEAPLDDDDDDSFEYAVAPASMKVISKMDAARPRSEARVREPREPIIMNLSAMLEEADKVGKNHKGSRPKAFGGGHGSRRDSSNASTTVTLKPLEMKKSKGSFRKTLSRLAGGKTKNKTNANKNIGLVSCDSDDEPRINEYVDYCISKKEEDNADMPQGVVPHIHGGSIVTAPPAKTGTGTDDGPIVFNKNHLLSKILEDSAGSFSGNGMDEADLRLKLGASMDEGAGHVGLEASNSFQHMVNEMRNEQEDRAEIMDKIDALAWRDPALLAMQKTEDMSLPPLTSRHLALASDSTNGDSVAASSFGVRPKFAQVEVGSVVMNDLKLVNTDEVAQAVKSGAIKKPKAKPTALQRQRSRKDKSHDDHDAPALKVSDSFDNMVGKRRSDLIEQRKQYELSQMEAFLNAYGEDAYKQVYGPYEEQLGYGLFYNQKNDEAEATPQQDPLDKSMHSEAIMSQDEARLDDIPEDKPVTRGRSMVRSAARKMKRSLSRKRSTQKQPSNVEKVSQSQQPEQQTSQPQRSKEQGEYHDIKSMASKASRASRTSSRGKSSRANSSKGAESSTRQSSNVRSDDAHFQVAPLNIEASQPTDTAVATTSPVSSTQYQAQETQMSLQSYSGQYHQRRPGQVAANPSYSGDVDGAVYGMVPGTTSTPQAPPSPQAQAPAPILRNSAPPMVTESQLMRQRSSNRNNRNSVDCLLRRMRSESTDAEEGDSPFEGL